MYKMKIKTLNSFSGNTGGNVQIKLQDKIVIPTIADKVVTADVDYDGLQKVTVKGVTSNIDNNITPGNIKKGVTILNVEGSLDEINTTDITISPTKETQTFEPTGEYNGFSNIIVEPIPSEFIIPNGTLDINENGEHDVLNYTNVNVDVNPLLQTKTITPTTEQQTINADEGYYGLSEVVVKKVTNNIDSNIIASNIKKGIEILGVQGSVVELNGDTLNVTPSNETQTFTPSEPKNGYTQVVVEGIPNGEEVSY